MNLVQHPLVRTSQDVRRSISRLKAYLNTHIQHLTVADVAHVKQLIASLENVHQSIPSEYRDADLSKGG